MTTLNYIAIGILSFSIGRLLANIAVWTYHHYTRAGRIHQRINPPKYHVGIWLFMIGVSIGWFLQ